MISKELFIKMMKQAQSFSDEVDRWSNFGIDVFDLPIGSIPWEMFNTWVDSHFDYEGAEWISWYLWERVSVVTGGILACYDENGDEFYVNDLQELWNIVESHRLKPSLDETCAFYKTCKNHASINKS